MPVTSAHHRLLARLRGAWHSLVAEVAKFGTVGAVAFVVDVGLYNLLVFGLPGGVAGPLAESPLLGKAAATTVATVVAWTGNRWWTFRRQRRSAKSAEFVLFVFFNALGLGIALAALGFSRYVLGLDSQLADNISGNGIGLALGTLFRFWAYKRFVFRGHLEVGASAEQDAQRFIANGR